MPSSFVIANELEVSQMESLDDVYRFLEKQKQLVGGGGLEEIVALSEIVLGEKKDPNLVKDLSEDKAQIYLFDSELWQRLAALEQDQLLDLSVPWSETDYWETTTHNRMDLAGFLLEISALSQRAVEEQKLLCVVVEK